MTDAYPLAWPAARPRCRARKDGNFNKKQDSGRGWRETKQLTIADAMRRLQDELDRLGGTNFVLSSNLIRNIDGSPRSGQAQPVDPGVALYFQLKGKPICMPCDTYTRVEQNIAAIAKHIEATRAIERYGVASLAEMFAGFIALPKSGERPWREVFGFEVDSVVDRGVFDLRFRRLAAERHPDAGGSDAMMAELNVARAAGLKEIA